MTDFFVWPRMDSSTAEKLFMTVKQNEGPEVNLDVSNFDYSGIGRRKTSRELQDLRDRLIEIAEPYGFKARRRYDAYEMTDDPGAEARAKLDREYTLAFHELVPMRWAEAGSNEVWSWFSLAFLPDLTHWRWRFASTSLNEKWNRERWIGGDLPRHTWARYWWRTVRFSEDPSLIDSLNETEMTQLLERPDVLGANPKLMAAVAPRLGEFYELYSRWHIRSKNEVVRDVMKRLIRRLAYVDDAVLNETELNLLVDDFFDEISAALSADPGGPSFEGQVVRPGFNGG